MVVGYRWFFCIASLVALSSPALALETDQYTPPPGPLADVSAQFEQKLRATLQEAVSQANIDYLDRLRSAEHTSLPFLRDHYRAQADYLQTEDAIAERLDALVGTGLVETPMESWLRNSVFPQGPHQFAPSIGESVYGANVFGRPPTLIELSPTINLFGVYFGTDKIGHFFQQGRQYHTAYRKAERNGDDAHVCCQAAVALGVFQEENYYGLLTVGVYSNADLAANYAGMKFFPEPHAAGGHQWTPTSANAGQAAGTVGDFKNLASRVSFGRS